MLGLGHDPDPAGCDLMNQYLCEHYPLGDGTMTCQWVSQRDARRAVRLYGGSVALAPEACLVEPLPPAPVSPLASGGKTGPRRSRGRGRSRPGCRVDRCSWSPCTRRTPAAATRSGASSATYRIPPTGSSWADPEPDRWQEEACYVLRSLNYWGGSSALFETTR